MISFEYTFIIKVIMKPHFKFISKKWVLNTQNACSTQKFSSTTRLSRSPNELRECDGTKRTGSQGAKMASRKQTRARYTGHPDLQSIELLLQLNKSGSQILLYSPNLLNDYREIMVMEFWVDLIKRNKSIHNHKERI